MKKKKITKLYLSLGMLVAFIAWTAAVKFIDVRAIGPRNSCVGFSALNGFVHSATGVHMTLYTVTDWLGLVPIAVAFGFAVFGFVQLLKRKSFLSVDKSILALGGFYIAVIAVYMLFESVVINYRPVLIEGFLEVSYPSSTTTLVMCVMPTALMQFNCRIKNKLLRKIVASLIVEFTAFMVVGRLISGVHWVTDIVGGALISACLVLAYAHFSDRFNCA